MTSDFSVTALHDFSIVTDSGRCEPYFLGSMSYTQQRLKPERSKFFETASPENQHNKEFLILPLGGGSAGGGEF